MIEADVIIVGSGPIGAVSATSLAKRGKNVLLLDAGDAVSVPPGAHLRNQQQYQENPDRFFEEIGRWFIADNRMTSSRFHTRNLPLGKLVHA